MYEFKLCFLLYGLISQYARSIAIKPEILPILLHIVNNLLKNGVRYTVRPLINVLTMYPLEMSFSIGNLLCNVYHWNDHDTENIMLDIQKSITKIIFIHPPYLSYNDDIIENIF